MDIEREKRRGVRSLIQIRISKLKRSMNTEATSIFKDYDVAVDKASSNIVLICKEYSINNIDCLKIEFGLDSSRASTNTTTTLSKEAIFDNRESVLVFVFHQSLR